MPESKYPRLGATVKEGGVEFRVWAPKFERAELVVGAADEMEAVVEEIEADEIYAKVLGDAAAERSWSEHPPAYELHDEGDGVYATFVPGLKPGALYKYRVDGNLFPDPASRFQPEGVHGPSMVVDPSSYTWKCAGWRGIEREKLVFYELHVGTFSPEGTFEGVRKRLGHLKDLGITALEIMPVADFPGRWSWGYDQASLFAPSRAYGTPDDLRCLVDEAHGAGLAVFLDAIYNHFGPDGAYAAAYGPYFTDKHESPWGQGVNLDDEGARHVRDFFIANALHWLTEYHFDGLRLDAAHALKDDSPQHFLAELSEAVAALPGRKRYLVAEDERNERRLLEPREQGGYGLDGVWADDFHHLIRNVTAGDDQSYYADFAPASTEMVATALRQGWFYTGQHSRFHGHDRGTDPAGINPAGMVICIQNHDQIGNRAQGNRLTTDTSPAMYRAASAVLLFAPEMPLIFQGQEWGTKTPFQFFTDHSEELGKLVSEGRKKEFASFKDFAGSEVPDPQDPETFNRSKLDWSELERPEHAGTLRLYMDLLKLRRELPADFEADGSVEGGLVLRRGPYRLLAAFAEGVRLAIPDNAEILLYTESEPYAGESPPPVVEAGAVVFNVPGAVVLRETGR